MSLATLLEVWKPRAPSARPAWTILAFIVFGFDPGMGIYPSF